MKTLFLTVLALVSTSAFAAAPRHPAPHRAAPRDWTQVAAATPDEGMRLGNPAAKVKLVEMLSFTCPHCAAFEKQAIPPLLAKYVRSGAVSYEVRIAIRDPFDLAAATLARCDGPKRFFQLAPILYAAQDQWVKQATIWQETAPDLSKMSEADAGRALAKGAGLDRIVAAHGMTGSRVEQCMGDVAGEQRLSSKAQAIWAMPGFPGTPAFLLDGQLDTDIHDWATLDAALNAALH